MFTKSVSVINCLSPEDVAFPSPLTLTLSWGSDFQKCLIKHHIYSSDSFQIPQLFLTTLPSFALLLSCRGTSTYLVVFWVTQSFVVKPPPPTHTHKTTYASSETNRYKTSTLRRWKYGEFQLSIQRNAVYREETHTCRQFWKAKLTGLELKSAFKRELLMVLKSSFYTESLTNFSDCLIRIQDTIL